MSNPQKGKTVWIEKEFAVKFYQLTVNITRNIFLDS